MKKILKESIQKEIKEALTEAPFSFMDPIKAGISGAKAMGQNIAGNFRVGKIKGKVERVADRVAADWQKAEKDLEGTIQNLVTSKNPTVKATGQGIQSQIDQAAYNIGTAVNHLKTGFPGGVGQQASTSAPAAPSAQAQQPAAPGTTQGATAAAATTTAASTTPSPTAKPSKLADPAKLMNWTNANIKRMNANKMNDLERSEFMKKLGSFYSDPQYKKMIDAAFRQNKKAPTTPAIKPVAQTSPAAASAAPVATPPAAASVSPQPIPQTNINQAVKQASSNYSLDPKATIGNAPPSKRSKNPPKTAFPTKSPEPKAKTVSPETPPAPKAPTKPSRSTEGSKGKEIPPGPVQKMDEPTKAPKRPFARRKPSAPQPTAESVNLSLNKIFKLN